MDTPDPGVVEDSQQSRPQQPLQINTPKSAGFASPKPTQDSWTGPRRSQVRQVAKASFLADDDDTGEEADDQDDNHLMADPQEQFDNETNLDSTASEPDSGSIGESDEDQDQDLYNESPTPHASQAAHMPPQSAQPIQRSSRPDSSNPFSVFESLKRQPAVPITSQKPSQQQQAEKPGLGTQGTTATKGRREPPTKDTPARPKETARKSIANSKVKLSALELEGEIETGRPKSQKPQEYDYSLPASASKNATAAAAPVSHSSPHAHSGEEESENLALDEEVFVRAPREEDMRGKAKTRALKPAPPANEEDENQVLISSGSTSSFPESDNTDDEDFECTRKLTPANARRRTRAAAAESQARKEATAKAENNPAPVSSSRPPGIEDETRHRNAGVRPKAQPKQPTKKTAVEKSRAVAAPAKSTSKPREEMQSSAEKPKERNPTSERRAAVNCITKDKSNTKQDAVASSTAKPVGKGEANKVIQTSKPVKQTESSIRKPNVVAFGSGGPKINGRSHKATSTTDLRSQGQQLGLSDGEHPAASKTQLAKGSQKAPKTQLKTTVQDGDSPTNNFGGNAESDLGRAARTGRPDGGRVVANHAPVPKADKTATVMHSDAETTEPNYEAEFADAFDQFVAADAEADTLVEDATNVVADSQGKQKHEAADDFDETCDGGVLKPFAQRVKHPHMREHRTVLGEVGANRRSIAKDAPPGFTHLMKRKLPGLTSVTETSPRQQLLTSKSGLQSGNFPTHMNSAAVPSESEGRPVKKPRYNSARAFRVHDDAGHTGDRIGRPDSLPRGGGYDTGDDVFGPGKKARPFGSSAFVQRLISGESADRGPDQAGSVAPTSSEARAVPRPPVAATHHPATVRSVAPGVVSLPQACQRLDDMGRRMLAALEPEKPRDPSPCPPSDEHGTSFPGDDTKDSWLSDTLVQGKASELEERTRAWKKATEPYAESLGETMHKIVNVSRRLWHDTLVQTAN